MAVSIEDEYEGGFVKFDTIYKEKLMEKRAGYSRYVKKHWRYLLVALSVNVNMKRQALPAMVIHDVVIGRNSVYCT